ncbi:MAG TPA: gluconate 2-dehydrogenase subunit 3 family protein [Gemmatimonadaceae bacterium]|nr:gluconate 2-dehydrogenase subunit 3 family protein [Gemmatimonadaceae bacterium]
MERRELIRWLVGTAGVACLDGLAPDDLLAFGSDVHRQPSAGQGFRALNAHAQRTITIAAERIIPKSDTPGATDADVVSFVDKMLADWYAPEERDRFLAGVRELDDRSRALRSRTFIDCSEAEQIAILTAFDAEVIASRRNRGGANPNDHWFAMLKYLTVFGYCTSEVAMRQTLRDWPRPTRYDGCAPIAVRRAQEG